MLLLKSSNTTLPRSIVRPIHDRAIDFFLVTYAFPDSGPIRGCYGYLTVFLDGSGSDETFQTSLRAVALAAYACGFHYPDLLIEARRKFGVALRLVNTALSSPQATNDGTVISIILFSTFGVLTSQTLQTVSDCISHTDGAMMITKLRGHQQLESRPGLQLFTHICLICFPNCLLHSTRIPLEMIELRQHAATLLDANDPAWKLSSIMVKVAEFRAAVKEGTLCGCLSIVGAAAYIDAELAYLGENMPGRWRFEKVCLEEPTELLRGNYYHVYPDLWVAYIWNVLRICRLYLHEEISDQLKRNTASLPLSPSTNHINSQVSAKIPQQLILDICASVPQYCGDLSRLRSQHSNPPSFPSELPGPEREPEQCNPTAPAPAQCNRAAAATCAKSGDHINTWPPPVAGNTPTRAAWSSEIRSIQILRDLNCRRISISAVIWTLMMFLMLLVFLCSLARCLLLDG